MSARRTATAAAVAAPVAWVAGWCLIAWNIERIEGWRVRHIHRAAR